MSPARRTATVLFIDIVGSTQVASELGDARFRELLSRFNRIVRACLRRHGGHEEDRAGDGFFASFPEPARAIACASRLVEDVRELGVEIRAGIHTGETERIEGKTQGIAVVIGARVMSLAGPGDVLVTSTTKELTTGAGFSFDDLSGHELKGVPGSWQVWSVTGIEGTPRPRPLPVTEAADRRRALSVRQGRRVPKQAVIVGLASAAIVAGGVALMIPREEGEQPRHPPGPISPAPGTLLEIDPVADRILSKISLRPLQERRTIRHTAHALVVGQGGVWLVRRDQLIHVDPVDDDEDGRVAIGRGNPISINVASGYDAIWLMTDLELLRVHPGTREVRSVASLQRGPVLSWTTDVTIGAGYVWVGTSDGELLRFDPKTGHVDRKKGLSPIDAIAAGSGAVWTSDVLEGTVTRFDPETMEPAGSVEIPGGADILEVDGSDLWVLTQSAGLVTPVSGGQRGSQIRVGEDPTSLAAGLGAIWVGDEDGIIRRIDRETRQVDVLPVGAPIRAIRVDEEEDTIWVDVR